MGSISKISTQIVADSRQFTATLAAAEKVGQSTFARLAKLEFKPQAAPASALLTPAQNAANKRGDSLQAVYDLLGRIGKRAVESRDKLDLFMNGRADKGNPMVGLYGDMGKKYRTRMFMTGGGKDGKQPYTTREEIDPFVRGQAGALTRLRESLAGLATYKLRLSELVPTARSVYAAVSKPIHLAFVTTLNGVRVTARAIGNVGRGLGRGAASLARDAGGALSSFVPSPRTAALGMLATVGVSTYQFHEYAEKVIKSSIETRKFGVSANDVAGSLQRMQFALRFMGHDAEAAIDAMKTLEQLQVASRVGGYANADLMARLGGNAGEALKKSEDMSYVMNEVNEAIAAQGGGMRAVVLASHVYGDNYERILRFALLTGKAKAELNERGSRQGNFVTQDDVTHLQQTQLMIGRIGLALEGVVTKAVVAFAPLVLAGTEMFGAMLGGFDTDKMIADIKSVALQVVAFAVNLPAYFSIASDYIVLAIGRIAEAADKLQSRLYRMQATLLDAIPAGGGADKAAELNALADSIDAALKPGAKDQTWYSKMAEDALKSIGETKAALVTVDQLQALIAVRSRLARAQQPDYDKFQELIGQGRKNKALIDGALQTASEVESVYEKLQARLSKLDLMKGLTGNMSDATFGRAVLKAFNEAEAALQTMDIRLPGLANKDSAESVSAINRSEVEYRLKVADSPAVRQQRTLEQSLEVLRKLEIYAAASAAAAEARKATSVVRIP